MYWTLNGCRIVVAWKHVKLMEVTVSPDPDDPHVVGSVNLVKGGWVAHVHYEITAYVRVKYKTLLMTLQNSRRQINASEREQIHLDMCPEKLCFLPSHHFVFSLNNLLLSQELFDQIRTLKFYIKLYDNKGHFSRNSLLFATNLFSKWQS